MRYPTYGQHDMPANPFEPEFDATDPLLWAYVEHTADDMYELPSRQRLSDPLYVASQHVGQVCVAIADTTHEEGFDTHAAFNNTYTHLEQYSQGRLPQGKPSFEVRIAAGLLKVSASIVEAYADPEAFDARRACLHKQTIRSIQETLQAMPARNSHEFSDSERIAVGHLTQLAALALLTRIKHPRLLAMPALPHQDRRINTTGKGTHNFDIGLFELPARYSDSEASGAQVHKVQVKTACIGACSTEILSKKPDVILRQTRRLQARRTRQQDATKTILASYASDICLVSGCCDLGMGGDAWHANSPLAVKLVDEYQDKLNSREVRELDALTNKLLLTITDDTPRTKGEPARFGTAAPDRFVASR